MRQRRTVTNFDAIVVNMKRAPRRQQRTSQKRTVTLRMTPHQERRPREYLTPAEVDKLIEAARKTRRYGSRDATAILLAFRHGLRAGELCTLRWDQVDLKQGLLHVRRLKNGTPSVHPLSGVELRALRTLQRYEIASRFVFITERGAPMTPAGFRKMVERVGESARFSFPVHPHMLRHATGFKLANDGVDTRAIQLYLGHKQIQHTTRYTELSPIRFKDFWAD
jgi:integrase